MKPFPDSAVLNVPSSLAGHFYDVARSLPVQANKDFYQVERQTQVYQDFYGKAGSAFCKLLHTVEDKLQTPPFSVLLKGLQFDNHYCLFVALSRHFGEMVARPYNKDMPRQQLIHHIQPSTDRNNTSKIGKASEDLHVDGAERPELIRYVLMQCIHADPDGEGRSRLLDSYGFRTVLSTCTQARKLIETLEQYDVPWQLADYLGGGITWAPILKGEYVRWRRYTIDHAIQSGNVRLPESTLKALDTVSQALLDNDHHTLDFLLSPGDFLIVDNHRCLHARSAITNPRTPRLMLRGWVV